MKFMKVFSFLTGAITAFTVMLDVPMNQTGKTFVQSVTAEAAASDFTAEQAVAWANNCAATKWNKNVNNDAYGVQCVDLILAYYSYLGVKWSSGNATDYQKNTLPSGWTRVTSSPKPGDVIVWEGNKKINANYTLSKYGHIGIVVAVSGNKLTTVETNADGKVSYAQKVSRDASYAACFIRPNFSGSVNPVNYESMSAETVLFKNKATGTYMTVDGGKVSNGQNISVASKTSSDAFKFNISGGTSNYIVSKLNTSYIVNPYSDQPSNGTNITLYTKDSTDKTQIWQFEAVSGGYLIHSGYDESCVITADGTNVKLSTKTGNNNQIWILEKPVASLSSITVENVQKTDYYIGEEFDKTGIKVTANYQDGTKKDVTSATEIIYDFSKAGKATVTFRYTENNLTKSTDLSVTVKAIPTGFFKGSGTASDPFLIQNKEQLETLRNLVNNTSMNPVYGRAYYLQTEDIDLENENWIPIGLGYDENGVYDYQTSMFFGTYNGGGHYIKNLNVNGNNINAGLFGVLRRDDNAEVTCEVSDLVVTGQVKTTASNANAAGIAGQVQYSGLIKNCAFIGDVSGSNYTGGIAGYIYNGTARPDSSCISGCYHIGSVSSDKYAGGITGAIVFNSYADPQWFYGLIENCYQKGKVTGSTSGAICSEVIKNGVDCKASIINCFASTDCGATNNVKNADVNTTIYKSDSEMKKLSADIGEPFADNKSDKLFNGYTLFDWQIMRLTGDINDDLTVNISDAVMLQKWLLSSGSLTNWKNADLYEDGKIDVFDLIAMRKLIIQGK
ncbi:MAG: CHAP domain-containing protein [Ruminococcus sp.]|nr:CHAP domain-containing protein [Ruminococcus sp.]